MGIPGKVKMRGGNVGHIPVKDFSFTYARLKIHSVKIVHNYVDLVNQFSYKGITNIGAKIYAKGRRQCP